MLSIFSFCFRHFTYRYPRLFNQSCNLQIYCFRYNHCMFWWCRKRCSPGTSLYSVVVTLFDPADGVPSCIPVSEKSENLTKSLGIYFSWLLFYVDYCICSGAAMAKQMDNLEAAFTKTAFSFRSVSNYFRSGRKKNCEKMSCMCVL